jgi:hypothetical protein
MAALPPSSSWPHLRSSILPTSTSCLRAHTKSRQFGTYYERVARWNALPFLDAGEVIVSSELDGIHFDADQHRKLGETVAATVRSLLEVE